MRSWKFMLLLICSIILSSFIMSGCSSSSEGTESAKKQGQSKSKSANTLFGIVGIDVSGSYEGMTSKALKISKNIIMNANPGDEYFIRTISSESYPPKSSNGHDNTIAHEKFISLPSAPGRFNKRAKLRYLLAQRKFQAQKTNVVQSLEKMRFSSAHRTDIYGFIAAASDLFAGAPAGFRKVLMFATDLKDTAGFSCSPDLSGIEVVIFEFLVDADPTKSQNRRIEWVQRLKKWGATKVTVRPAN